MEKLRTRNTRYFYFRRSPESGLLVFLLTIQFICLQCVACSGITGESDVVDKGYVRLSFNTGEIETGWVDILVYGLDGTRELLQYERVEKGGLSTIDTGKVRQGVVVGAVVNFPFSFNLEAAARLESFEKLRIRASDDNPQMPVMSAMASIDRDDIRDSCICLQRLWCCICVDEIINCSLTRLESPQLYLSYCNPEAEVFRTKGFRREDIQTDTVRMALPCDLGYYAQYPMSKLWCYPNDNGADEPGCERTVINMEFVTPEGKMTASAPLPAITRGCELHCCLSIREDFSLEASFY